ncbi:MAG: formate--tetrahydrofolate ligase [Deltaproteobacteria bacterium]|nr:formate--tetrahydrofolate ligase [Deltaproteobacteria bacterium]
METLMAQTEVDPLIEKLKLNDDAIDPRGRQVVKIDPDLVEGDENGKIVLVTAMTPTPAGEGKTTTTIGLIDGLSRIGVKAIGALREPSLGPLFGMKGGAIGGGKSRVIPSEQINMHFTGDLHAVTSAHNLLSALVDNHLYFENEPKLDPTSITWGRVLDMNDRALRKVEVGSATKRGPIRMDRFDITAASEVMAILCLAKDFADLEARLDAIVVGQSPDGHAITAKDIGASSAMAAILLDATRPNLVRTLEDNPVLVHGGPFANLAQGTSSLMQTRLARKLADVVVTEAGFAFDLGGFKFLDIKGRAGEFIPDDVVLVVTVRALRHHGGVDFNEGPNVDAVKSGLNNISAHLEAMERLGLKAPLIAINQREDDADDEVEAICDFAKKHGTEAVRGRYFAEGGAGAEDLSKALMARLETSDGNKGYKSPYDDDDTLVLKIEKASAAVFGATGVQLTEKARADLAFLESIQKEQLPICLAKTHLSISDDKKVLGKPAPFELKVTGLRVQAGAGFISVLCGPILTMPGLPKKPAAAGVSVEKDAAGRRQIIGLK